MISFLEMVLEPLDILLRGGYIALIRMHRVRDFLSGNESERRPISCLTGAPRSNKIYGRHCWDKPVYGIV